MTRFRYSELWRVPSSTAILGLLVVASGLAVPSWGQVLTRLEEESRKELRIAGSQVPRGPLVLYVKEVGGIVWAGTAEGLFHVGSSTLLKRYPPEGEDPVEVAAIEEVGEETWFSAQGTILQLREASYEPVGFFADEPSGDRTVRFIVADNARTTVWVGIDEGIVFCKDWTMTQPARQLQPGGPGAKNELTLLALVNRQLWVGTNERAYYFGGHCHDNSEDFEPVPGQLLKSVAKAVSVGSDVYLYSNHSGQLYSVNKGESVNEGVSCIEKVCAREDEDVCVEEELWYTRDSVLRKEHQRSQILYRVSNGNHVPVDGLDAVRGTLSCVRKIGDHIWLGTTRGLFRRKADRADRPFETVALGEDFSVTIKDMVGTSTGIVAWSFDTGVYRVLEDVQMQIDLTSYSIGSFEVIPRDGVLKIKSVKYIQENGREVDLGESNGPTGVILRKNIDAFKHAISSDMFDSLNADLNFGATEAFGREVYVAVRDRSGNIKRIEGRPVVHMALSAISALISTVIVVSAVFLFLASMVILFFPILPVWIHRLALLAYMGCYRLGKEPGSILLSWSLPRRSVQKLIVDRWTTHFEEPLSSLGDDGVDWKGSNPIILNCSSSDAVYRLRTIALEAINKTGGMMCHHIPVFATLPGPETGSSVEQIVIDAIEDNIPYVNNSFCKNLFRYGEFVFLFEVSGRVIEEYMKSIRSLRGKGRIVVGRIEGSSSAEFNTEVATMEADLVQPNLEDHLLATRRASALQAEQPDEEHRSRSEQGSE